MLFRSGPLILAQLSGPKPSFSASDFGLVAHAGNIELMIVASPGPPFANLEALVAAAKDRPLTYAHGGLGGPSHLAFEYFKRTAGINLAASAYKSEAQLVEDLATRDIAVGSVALAPLLPRVRAGELRVLAVTSANRSPLLPATRTVAEAGYPGFEASTFNLLVTPAQTPRDIISRLNTVFNAGVNSSALQIGRAHV